MSKNARCTCRHLATVILLVAIILCLVICTTSPTAFAEEEQSTSIWDSIGGWIDQAAEDTSNWVTQAWEDTSDWVSGAATDVWNWTASAANDTWNWTVGAADDVWGWTVQTANGTWDGISGFFDPPSTEGTPAIVVEPEFPEGTLKMYLGYPVVKTELDNGYYNELEIGKDDPHFGLSIGKFYVSGFTGVTSQDGEHFIFLKTVGDNVELHFELTQDIDMLGGDTSVTINRDNGGYDRQFGVSPTDFGRGTLIVRVTDYQNNTGEPQIYTDYLSAKASGTADTVIALNEEGDYEVALDYEIKKDSRILGTAATTSSYTNYRIYFSFSVRNGNCMVYPFDSVTGDELSDNAITPNGFRLDMARSRYLTIDVTRSELSIASDGTISEDVRFNRPAKDGDDYSDEGIYVFTVKNLYTDAEPTTKTIYVGTDPYLIALSTTGMTVQELNEQIQLGYTVADDGSLIEP